MTSDNGLFSSYGGHKERRTGKVRGAFSKMSRSLNGWMLARAPALPAAGLHHHGSRHHNFHFFVRCVVSRNLDLLIKTDWSIICPSLLMRTLAVVGDYMRDLSISDAQKVEVRSYCSSKSESESIEVALDME